MNVVRACGGWWRCRYIYIYLFSGTVIQKKYVYICKLRKGHIFYMARPYKGMLIRALTPEPGEAQCKFSNRIPPNMIKIFSFPAPLWNFMLKWELEDTRNGGQGWCINLGVETDLPREINIPRGWSRPPPGEFGVLIPSPTLRNQNAPALAFSLYSITSVLLSFELIFYG